MLKTGFSRVDITPPLGTTLAGYFEVRHADGVLDPLLATAVAFDDGNTRSLIMSLDLIGFAVPLMTRIRAKIAESCNVPFESIIIACTHTHLGPCTSNQRGVVENRDYINALVKKCVSAAIMAFDDLDETEMFMTRGEARGVSFIRRYRMKDGSVRTNPGFQNPDIASPLGAPDEESRLLVLKRKEKPEIGIVNFQTHPDVIGGTKISADWPKFVRDTYETLIPNSRCMFINGAQGDTNHIDVSLSKDDPMRGGYERSRYMGRKIAMSVIADYELKKPVKFDKIDYIDRVYPLTFNKGTPDELDEAYKTNKIYREQGGEAVGKLTGLSAMQLTTYLAKCERIVCLEEEPFATRDVHITTVAIGDAVFCTFPGEPFTEVGRQTRKNSKYALTMTLCAANSYEGYYPTADTFDEGGYESATATFRRGSAEEIIAVQKENLDALYSRKAK